MNVIKYLISSPSGDLISFLSGIRQIWVDTGKKGVIYHRLDMVGSSYDGAIHPYHNDEKEPVCFNQYSFDMMRPLLLSQDYIEDYVVYKGQEFDFDLDRVRRKDFTNQPLGSLNRWPNYVFPQMAADLSQEWVSLPEGINNPYKNKIILNFTQRHRNTFLTYFFLKEYQQKLIFAGVQKERDVFCQQWDLDISLMQVDNFYELAKNIKNCMFYMGNQSFCFQLAEAQKTPRLLEIFPLMPNVIPIGENAYDYYFQDAVEFYFNKLLKS